MQKLSAPPGACGQPGFRKKLKDVVLVPLESPASSIRRDKLRNQIESEDINDPGPLWACDNLAYVAEAKAKTIELRHRTRELFRKMDIAEAVEKEMPPELPLADASDHLEQAAPDSPPPEDGLLAHEARTSEPPLPLEENAEPACPEVDGDVVLPEITWCSVEEVNESPMLPTSTDGTAVSESDRSDAVDEEEFARRKRKIRSIRGSMRERLSHASIDLNRMIKQEFRERRRSATVGANVEASFSLASTRLALLPHIPEASSSRSSTVATHSVPDCSACQTVCSGQCLIQEMPDIPEALPSGDVLEPRFTLTLSEAAPAQERDDSDSREQSGNKPKTTRILAQMHTDASTSDTRGDSEGVTSMRRAIRRSMTTPADVEAPGDPISSPEHKSPKRLGSARKPNPGLTLCIDDDEEDTKPDFAYIEGDDVAAELHSSHPPMSTSSDQKSMRGMVRRAGTLACLSSPKSPRAEKHRHSIQGVSSIVGLMRANLPGRQSASAHSTPRNSIFASDTWNKPRHSMLGSAIWAAAGRLGSPVAAKLSRWHDAKATLLLESTRKIGLPSEMNERKGRRRQETREGVVRLFNYESDGGGYMLEVHFPSTTRRKERRFERQILVDEFGAVMQWGHMADKKADDQYAWLCRRVFIRNGDPDEDGGVENKSIGIKGFDEYVKGVKGDQAIDSDMHEVLQSLREHNRTNVRQRLEHESEPREETIQDVHMHEVRVVAARQCMDEEIVVALHDWYESECKAVNFDTMAFLRKICRASGRPELDEETMKRYSPSVNNLRGFVQFVDLLVLRLPRIQDMSAWDIHRFAQTVGQVHMAERIAAIPFNRNQHRVPQTDDQVGTTVDSASRTAEHLNEW